MSDKHTNSEWFLSKVDNGIGSGGGIAIDAIDPADGELFEVCEVWGVDSDTVLDGRAKDNARRIVACVNACAGIPTSDLEDIKLRPTLDAYGMVVPQRDLLLEELVIILGSLKEICHLRQIPRPESAVRRAEVAIAAARGAS